MKYKFIFCLFLNHKWESWHWIRKICQEVVGRKCIRCDRKEVKSITTGGKHDE